MALGKSSDCILIMEDEDLVSTIAVQMFEYIGYDSVLAKTGEAAIELYRQRYLTGSPFTAVIMDLTIPNGMGGEAAVKEILKIDPGAKVIVSSGYTLDPAMVDYREHGFVAAIAKPFNLPDLTRIMQELRG